MQPLCMRDRERTGAKMFGKQTSQMTTRYAEPVRKSLDVTVIESTIRDEPQPALDRC